MNKERILIVDDDFAVCSSLELLFKKAGFDALSCNQPNAALEKLEQFKPHLILLDLNYSIDTSGKQGIRLFEKIKSMAPQLPVILMTGWGTLELAVRGMKMGAKDFITKPWDNKELLKSVRTILDLHGSVLDPSTHTSFKSIIGKHPSLLKVLAQAEKVAATNASVLIYGESGTGKELLAEAIHAKSSRSSKPFVKVNLGGITGSLFESEMFGHVKGAFTDANRDRIGRFELADQGTIFLDEIGEVEMQNQVKLLRVLQEQTIEVVGSSSTKKLDFRVISATNKKLESLIVDKKFREDLFYRINLITLTLPPLRERPDDIPILVDHFNANFCKLNEVEEKEISLDAYQWLQEKNFPGNIRELKNLVDRTIILSTGRKLKKSDFEQNLKNKQEQNSVIHNELGFGSIEEMEKTMVRKALHFHQNNISEAATALGITRSALYRRMQKFNIANEAE